MNDLFDYSEKSTEWLQDLRDKLGMFDPELRRKVSDSIDAELNRRGVK